MNKNFLHKLEWKHNLQHQPTEAEIPVQVKNSSQSIKNNKQKCDIGMQRKTTATCNNMDTPYKLSMEWRKHDTKE